MGKLILYGTSNYEHFVLAAKRQTYRYLAGLQGSESNILACTAGTIEFLEFYLTVAGCNEKENEEQTGEQTQMGILLIKMISCNGVLAPGTYRMYHERFFSVSLLMEAI